MLILTLPSALAGQEEGGQEIQPEIPWNSLEFPPFLPKYPAVKPLGWIFRGCRTAGEGCAALNPCTSMNEFILGWNQIHLGWDGNGEGTRSWAFLRLEHTLRGFRLQFGNYPAWKGLGRDLMGKGPGEEKEKRKNKISTLLTFISK